MFKCPWITLCALLLWPAIAVGKRHSHAVPTYFHRKYHNGSFIDRRNDQEFKKIFVKQYKNYVPKHASGSVIEVTPPLVFGTKQSVTVSWSITVKASLFDWIGLYCPKEDPIADVLDYFFVTESHEWFSGQGQHEVTLFNVRTNCEFRYYHFEKEHLIAVSKPFLFNNGEDIPMHGHIAMTNVPGQMRVMWVSKTDTMPVVYYGLFKEIMILKSYGTTTTYNASDMCGSPANAIGYRDPGFIHDVLLKVLLPNTRYYYKFGSGENFSPVYNFTTPLVAGDPSPHKILTFGDHGVDFLLSPGAHETSISLIQEVQKSDIRMILHNGDISYAMGYAYIWDQWSALVEPYATLVPYMIGLGNHEQDHIGGGDKDPSGAGDGFHPKWGNYGSDSGGECGVPMYKRFHMPDDGHAVWWYSFDFGLVHYIMLSTEHDFSPNSTQYQWLEADLKKVDRRITPWLVVSGHRPMYLSQQELDEIEVAVNMQRLFEDLLYQYKVDLCLWAHVHSYERTCKLYKNMCTHDGIVHIITGTAGRALDLEPYKKNPWSEFRSVEYGYGRITIYSSKALKYEFLSSSTMEVVDSYLFEK